MTRLVDKITKIKNLLDELNWEQKHDICQWLHIKLHWKPSPEDGKYVCLILNESESKIDGKIINLLDKLNWQEQQDICDWLHLKLHYEPRPEDGEDIHRVWNELIREIVEAEKKVEVWQAEFLKVLWRVYVPMLKNANFPVPNSMRWRILERYNYNAYTDYGVAMEIYFDPTRINNDEQFLYHFLHEIAHLRAGKEKDRPHGDKFKNYYIDAIDTVGGDLKKAAKWEEGQPDVKSYLLEEAERR